MGGSVRKMGKVDEPLLASGAGGEVDNVESVSHVGRDDDEIRGKRHVNLNRKVQWSDDKGKRLVEVFEFEPSESSDSDDDDFFDSYWPWKKLGSFKWVVLAPWIAHSVYTNIRRKEEGRGMDLLNIAVLPIQILRIIHTQAWISFSRFMTCNSKNKIVNKSLEFEQVDRERNWDDQIVLTAVILYLVSMVFPNGSELVWWDTKGIALVVIIHTGPVEFLYYWLHRALHHHFLYSRYHSHHHASIVTEPITAVIHPFAEELAYFGLFAIPLLTAVYVGMGSIAAFVGYLFYIDLMNYLGHCNFEIVPDWLFAMFPPLKYLMYTPSFHSLHHTQFRTNYSLFMPFYDYVYNTADNSTDRLYENSLKRMEDRVDVVHLTHPTTLMSMYHLRTGFPSLASRPYHSILPYKCLLWPFTCYSLSLTWFCRSPFPVERNNLGKLQMQTWAIPAYTFQYSGTTKNHGKINQMIEKAINHAEGNRIRVLSLGLLNQDEELNQNGELYIAKNPKLKLRVVDGSCLAVAVVVKSIPQGTKQVIITGKLSKVGFAVAKTLLSQREIQVIAIHQRELDALKLRLPVDNNPNLILSNHKASKVWLVDDGLSEEDQRKAEKGARFIPFSQFPPKECRRDCIYHATPSMLVPKYLENMHSCENWLPRRVMSAWRIAGMVHALEEWNQHEVGDTILDVDEAWNAALSHGFLPFQIKQSTA